jgi:hypothetical protein
MKNGSKRKKAKKWTLPAINHEEMVYSVRLGRPVLVDLQRLQRERKAGKIFW